MHTKNFSAVVLAATLAACGPVTSPAPDAQGADASTPDVVLATDATPARPDAFAPDVSTPDAAVTDASEPDAVAPDASVPDVAVPDAGPGTRAVASSTEICGVAVVAGATSARSEFTLAWAENPAGGDGVVHVAHVDGSGSVSNDHIVARGPGRKCVTRGSLSSDGSVVAWSRTTDSNEVVEGAVLGPDAAPVMVIDIPFHRQVSAPLTEVNLVVERSGDTAVLAFEMPGPGVRLLELSVTPGPAAAVIAHDTFVDLATNIGARVLLAQDLVAYTRRGTSGAETLYGRRFYSRGWEGDEFAIPMGGDDPRPLALRGSRASGGHELLFDAGLRDRSLHRASIARAPSEPATSAPVATNTAWHSTVADFTSARPDVVWTSHGLFGGYNALLLLAPAGHAEPHRCVAMRAGHEQGGFPHVAHAQRASRNRLVAAVVSVPEGRARRETLFVRGVADGATVCE